MIRGSICALATPFHPDGSLDLVAFGRMIDAQIDNGTQALVVAGSTGEAHMLERDEFDRLLTYALERVAGRVPVVAGTGQAATSKTVRRTRRACELGADAALVVVPYYVRPSQEGLYRHFLEIAEHGGLPLLLYNVPLRSACDMLPDTVARLRAHQAIIGIKDACKNLERIRALAALAGPDFVYLSGDDATAGEAMLAGAGGTVSVVANLVPKCFRALCDAATKGDKNATARCQAALEPLLCALECAPNPIAVKAGLLALGLTSESLRLPMLALQEGPAREQLYTALGKLAPICR